MQRPASLPVAAKIFKISGGIFRKEPACPIIPARHSLTRPATQAMHAFRCIATHTSYHDAIALEIIRWPACTNQNL